MGKDCFAYRERIENKVGKKYYLVDQLPIDGYAIAVERVAQAMALETEYTSAPLSKLELAELDDDFPSLVYVPYATRNYCAYKYPDLEDFDALLEAAWDAARRYGAMRSDGNGSVVFPLPLPMTCYKSHPAEVTVSPSRRSDSELPWYAPHLGYRTPASAEAESVFAFGEECDDAVPIYADADLLCSYEDDGSPLECGKSHGELSFMTEDKTLREYAYLGHIDNTISKLIAMIGRGKWGDDPQRLLGYLASTFCEAQKQDKVAESSRLGIAVFNTGLVSQFSDAEVFMVFTPNWVLGRQDWAFASFALVGEGRYGKMLVELAASGDLPSAPLMPALSFNDSPVHVDYWHLLKRLFRLPMGFVHEALLGDERGLDLLAESMVDGKDSMDQMAFSPLISYVSTHADAYAALRQRLEDAVDASIERCRADHALVATGYNPSHGNAVLLIPLWIDGELPAASLLATPVSGGWQVHTVLTLEQASATAYVVGDGAGAWLNQADQAGARAAHEDALAWAEQRIVAGEQELRSNMEPVSTPEQVGTAEASAPTPEGSSGGSQRSVEDAGEEASRHPFAAEDGCRRAAAMRRRGLMRRVVDLLVGTPEERMAARRHSEKMCSS